MTAKHNAPRLTKLQLEALPECLRIAHRDGIRDRAGFVAFLDGYAGTLLYSARKAASEAERCAMQSRSKRSDHYRKVAKRIRRNARVIRTLHTSMVGR